MVRYYVFRFVIVGIIIDYVFIKLFSIIVIIMWLKCNIVLRGNNLKKFKWVDFVFLCIIECIVNDYSGSIRFGLFGKYMDI